MYKKVIKGWVQENESNKETVTRFTQGELPHTEKIDGLSVSEDEERAQFMLGAKVRPIEITITCKDAKKGTDNG